MSEQGTGASFATYGVAFQERILQAMLVDQKFAEQMLEVFDVSYFDVAYLAFLADRFFAHARKYKVFPTLQLLVTIVKDELKTTADAALRDRTIDYLTRMRSNPNPGDLSYVKDKSLDFCRKQALRKALEVAVDQMEDSKYDQIVDGIKKAVQVGTAPSMGHDFFTDYEARFTKLARHTVPTGIPEIDRREIMNGGLAKGELGVIVGATGAGKSHFLVHLGCCAMRAGVDVLHYTMELSETTTGVRYDSNLCDVDASSVIESKQTILERYKDMKLGRLMIKEFPTSTATIYSLRSHAERLDVRGFRPGLIIIDYADIMRSTRQYDSLRHELKLIYEELRAFADERSVPLWTASQSNREGSNAEVIDLQNMSEAYGKAMTADTVLSISRRSHEKAGGTGRLYVAKNRAGRDGIVFPVSIDTSKSKFAVTGDAGSVDQVQTDDKEVNRRALANKWKELQSDPMFKKKKDE